MTSDLPLFRSEPKIETSFKPGADIVLLTGDVADVLSQIPDGSITLIHRVSIEQYL